MGNLLIPKCNQTRYALTPALSHREREIERELSAGVTDFPAFWYEW
jgi:DNA-binding CsgD family transcriptional regulator